MGEDADLGLPQRINQQFDMVPHWWGKVLLAVAYGLGFSAIGIGMFWMRNVLMPHQKALADWIDAFL